MSQAEANGDYIHTGNSDKITVISEPPNLPSPMSPEQKARGEAFLNEPKIVHEGRYRLYENPDGGLYLVYKRNDMDELQHMEIPGALMRLAQMGSEGKLSPMTMMREMMKLRNE